MTRSRQRLHRRTLACILAIGVGAAACTGGKPAPNPTGSGRTSAAPYRLRVQPAAFHLPAPVEREVAVLANDTIYLAGGLSAAGQSANGVFTLNPATGELASVGKFPQAFHDAAGAFIGGRLFVFGGGRGESSDAVQAFDPDSGKAIVAGHLPKALSDLSSATVGRAVYLVGGYDGVSPQSAIYATTDGVRFRTAGRLPRALRYAAVASVGSTVVIAGGVSGAGPVSNVYLFDTRNGHVAVLGRLPTAVGHAAAFTIGAVVYVAGGMDSHGGAIDQVVAVDPGARTINREPPLPSPLSDAAVASDGSTAWLVGGRRGSALSQVLTAKLARA